MKPFLILGTLLYASLSFANTCHISLYDPADRPYLNFYSSYDKDCKAAAQRCYMAISQYRLNPYQYKCYTISMTEDPRTTPPQPEEPREEPKPEIPKPSGEARRDVETGETVLFKGKRWVVTDTTQVLSLKPEGGKEKDIVESISRQEVAITRGCQREICTKSAVIDMSSKTYLSVEGIDYEGRYITQSIGSTELKAPLEYRALARTSGCVTSTSVGVCAGNIVIARNNVYYKVAGIQPDNRVVIESEENDRKLYFDVDPASLTVTR